MGETKDHFHEKPLRWIASPLEDEDVDSSVPDNDLEACDAQSHLIKENSDCSPSDGARLTRFRTILRKRPESGPSELFYDLFFVANLSSFTSKHDITSHVELASYVGFFTLLWGTWYQVSLYDVRLSRDSIFDRCSKAIQFGVMLGFAIIGTYFDPSDTSLDSPFYDLVAQPLSLILMASRVCLAVQYGSAAWLARHEAGVWKPSTVIALTYTVTGFIYLGISFVFPMNHSSTYHAYVMWYVLFGLETFSNTLCSCIWTHLNFKSTHLVERMSLLTLIILGEGVIGLLESVTIAWSSGFYYASFISTVICATLILYFLYQLYFDNLPDKHFGTIREQIWAILHLPLHTAIVLCVEGSRLFVVWKVALEVVTNLQDTLYDVDMFNAFNVVDNYFTGAHNSTAYFASQASNFTDIADFVVGQWSSGLESGTISSINSAISNISDGVSKSNETELDAMFEIMAKLYGTVFRAYEIEPPSGGPESDTPEALLDQVLAFFHLYDLVLVDFFVATGCILLVLGTMIVLSKGKRHSRYGRKSAVVDDSESEVVTARAAKEPSWTTFDYLRISVYFLVGLGLALLSLMDLSAKNVDDSAGETFLESYWILPTVVLALFSVLVIQHLPLERIFRRKGKQISSS